MRSCSRPFLVFAALALPILVGANQASPTEPQTATPAAGFKVLGQRPPDVAPVPGQPLEMRDPIGTGQKPAAARQTRAVAVATKTPLRADVVATGLRNPWALAFLPDGRMLMTEKPGSMRIVSRDGQISAPVRGVPEVVFGGDAGLLDVALDPAFATNRRIYVTYVEPRAQGNGVSVGRARLADDLSALSEFQVILRVEPTITGQAHYGARLLFDRGGKLLVSLSERMVDPYRSQAQALDSLLGKILRIETDGRPASDNPFVNTAGARAEVWSTGHRDPQGLAFHPDTGELWVSDHGPQGGDEINVVSAGKNYGWPVIAYGTEYDGRLINGGLTAREGLEQPVYYWDPAVAPSGATFYSGRLLSEWKNNLFVATLAGQHLSRLILEGRTVVGEERLLLDQRQRMRDIREGPDGALGADRQPGRPPDSDRSSLAA